jgi:hypothetical protein
MAALTATDWTVTVQERRIENKKKVTKCLLTLATAGSYPSGGIPLPSFSALGLKRNLEYIMMIDANPTASYLSQYDVSANTIRILTDVNSDDPSLTELATTVTVGASASPYVLTVEAKGW